MKLTEICIHRPVLATVLSLVLILLGIVTFSKLQVRHYPNIDQPTISIRTSFPGASGDIVETQITKILEKSLAGIEGIQEMTSTSNTEMSLISLTFKLDRDIDAAANDVRDRVSKARKDLPQNLQPSIISKASADASSTISLVLTTDNNDLRDAADYVKQTLESELSAAPGVATVEVYGGGDLTMFIRVDPYKMAGYNITAEDINLALNVQGIEKPAGELYSKYAEISVSTKAPLKTEEDFRNVVIAERKGYPVKISDIAQEVKFEAVETRSSVRFNGKPCVLMNVIKQSVANPITVANGIHELIPKIRSSIPKGMTLEVANDASVFIKRSIDAVYQTIAEAAILVILVIFFFLRSFRASFIPIVTIPLSLIGTFAIMYFMGFSVNVLTLLALVMAIGLVVDDAIVVLENIYRHIEDGMSPMQATIKGSKEIGVAVVAMTITLAAVYAPIALSSGMTGRIFSEFALTLAGAVILSGFIALTLSPMMCGRLLKMHEKRPKPTSKSLLTFGIISLLFVIGAAYLENRFNVEHLAILTIFAIGLIAIIVIYDDKINVLLERTDQVYEKILRSALLTTLFKFGKGQNTIPVLSRAITLLIGIIIAVIGGVIAMNMKQDLSTAEDQGKVIASAFIPQGANLAFVDKYTKQAEAILKKVPEVKNQLTFTELKGGRSTIENFLVPWEKRSRSSMAIANSMRPQLAEITGMPFPSVIGQGRSLTSNARGGNPIQLTIQTTKSFEELRSLFEEFHKRFVKVEGVDTAGMEQTVVPDTQELVVDIDRMKAAELGVDLKKVGDMIEILLSRNPATHFTITGNRYPVVIELSDKFRHNPEDLASLYYRVNKGRDREYMVPLGEFVNFKYKVTPGGIAHTNGMRSVTLMANLKQGAGLGKVLDEANDIAQQVLPRGTARFELGGDSRNFKEESSNIALIFVLAVISIYLVLSAQYESFLDPLIIMVSVPLSLVGGIITLMLFGGDGFQTQSQFPWVYDFQFGTMTIYGKIGLVTLIGLITKHGILIVDFSNKLLVQGHNRFDAVIMASRQRLRPILMTTFAMVLGAIPLAIATGAGYESRRQIGWVIVGGMTFGTIFTLFIVPAFYTYISPENLGKLLSVFKRNKESAKPR